MISFKSEAELFKFLDDRHRDSFNTRAEKGYYAIKNRAFYNGFHWLRTAQTLAGGVRMFFGQPGDWREEYASDEGMRVTVNRITGMTIQNASSTEWKSIGVVAKQPAATPDIEQRVTADLVETVASVAVDSCRLLGSAKRANLERCIDAMHGIGVRIERPAEGGDRAATIRSFTFDGYQLCLDPTELSHDLRDHHEVLYDEVMTWHAAKRAYGDKLSGIDEKKLRSVAELLPHEVGMMALSNGRMYSHLSSVQNEKAVLVSTLWLRGPGKRFDRMYVVVDTVGRQGPPGNDKRAINFENPENPYGGCGMPLTLLTGYMRPGEALPISDVGMMCDDQNRLNLSASLYMQQVFDLTTNVIYAIDSGWMGQNRIDQNSIEEQLRQGILIGRTNGAQRFAPPQLITRPQPSQSLPADMAAHESGMRQQAFQSNLHAGEAKTHVPDATNQLTVELVEAPLEDRRDEDVGRVGALVEVIAGTMVGLVRRGSAAAIQSLKDAGVNETQIGRLIRAVDPNRLPVSLAVSRDSVRHRTTGQMRRDLIRLAELGVHNDPIIRGELARLDFPLSPADKGLERWANRKVADIIAGEEYEPVPLGPLAQVMIDALAEGMRTEPGEVPDARERLMRAYQAQIGLEQSLLPEEPAAATNQGFAETTLDDIFGSVGAVPA